MLQVDMERSKREQLRWLALITLNAARPVGANEHLMLSIVHGVPLHVTQRELRLEMDYLEERGLVKISNRHAGVWFGELTRDGIDVVEYTVDCDPGIARPVKYW